MGLIPDPFTASEGMKKLVGWMKRRHHLRTQDDIFEFYQWIEDIERAGHVNTALFAYYEDLEPLYSPRPKEVYPILTSDSWLTPTSNINDVLGGYSSEMVTSQNEEFLEHLESDHKYLNWNPDKESFDQADPHLWNGRCYRLVDCSPAERDFTFGLTDYFSYVSDCERIAYELINTLKANEIQPDSSKEKVERAIEGELPIREQRADTFEAMLDCRNHFYKVGINTLTVLRTSEDEYYSFMLLRSSKVAEFPGRYHVIPSGTFQPIMSDGVPEFDLKLHIMREFGEELFDIKEFDDSESQAVTAHWIRREDAVDKVYHLFNSGDAHLYYTGFGFDCLTAKPELTALLFIDDPSYFENFGPQIKANFEYSKERSDINYGMNISDRDIQERVAASKIIPAGAMAYFEGIDVLHSEFSLEF